MNKQHFSVTTLLERVEYEIETANGRTAWVCRDASGSYWVVDSAERVVSLYDFADECNAVARESCALGRAEFLPRIAAWAKDAFERVAKRVQRAGARTARA